MVVVVRRGIEPSGAVRAGIRVRIRIEQAGARTVTAAASGRADVVDPGVAREIAAGLIAPRPPILPRRRYGPRYRRNSDGCHRPSSSGCCRAAAIRRPRRPPLPLRFRETSRRLRPSAPAAAPCGRRLTVGRLTVLSRTLCLLHHLAAVPCRAVGISGGRTFGTEPRCGLCPKIVSRIESRNPPDERRLAGVRRSPVRWMRSWARFSASSCSRTVCTSA